MIGLDLGVQIESNRIMEHTRWVNIEYIDFVSKVKHC